MKASQSAVWYTMIVLFAINTLNFFDRLIIGAVGEPIRKEFGLSDASLGALGTAFILLYAVVGIPFGRLADRAPRKLILSVGVLLWSLLTAASGLAQNFWQMFALRLGVGVGEASCAPASTSLIGDLYPTEKRGRAISIFMMGLPIGIALSFAVSGTVTKAYGWRAAFLVAGIPGVLLAIAALFIREPIRGASDVPIAESGERSPYRKILSSPTMRWIIVSGVLHNFSLYAISSFLTPFLMRYHGLDIQNAGFAAMVINGILTLPGLLIGGFVGDALKKRRSNGALIVAAVACTLAAPLYYLSLGISQGDVLSFVLLMGSAIALVYFYYPTVYSTIQDITPANQRGTAMSVYFLAMYLLGGALGPYVLGLLSDYFTQKAATASGILDFTSASLEPFRSVGLQSAMYIVPVLCVALALVMMRAASTLSREVAPNERVRVPSTN
jgi:predicted MFS family arabinose efflux permease